MSTAWAQEVLPVAPFSGLTSLGNGRVRIGDLELHPFLSYTGEYDDNIFREPKDKQSDYINYISPGVALKLPFGRHELLASYRMDLLRAFKNKGIDDERNFLKGTLKLDFGKLDIAVGEDFRDTSDFPSSELTQRVKRIENSFHAKVSYAVIGRFGVGLSYANHFFDFQDPAFNTLDRDENVLGASVFYRILPRASLFVRYDFAQERFDIAKERDADKHRGFLGIEGEIGPKLKLIAKGGYGIVDLKDQALQSIATWLAEVDGVYRPLHRLSMSLILRRSVEVASFTDNFEAFAIGFGVSYAFRPWLTFSPRISYERDEFPRTERQDTIFGVGMGLRFQLFRYTFLEGSYGYQKRSSSVEGADFTDNRLFWSLIFSM
ncbi:MAG: outer membrane beta-barrel protein [Candidatus Methylomirabilales bacterium]